MSRVKSERAGAVPAAAADSGALLAIIIEYGADSNRRAWQCPADSRHCACRRAGAGKDKQRPGKDMDKIVSALAKYPPMKSREGFSFAARQCRGGRDSELGKT